MCKSQGDGEEAQQALQALRGGLSLHQQDALAAAPGEQHAQRMQPAGSSHAHVLGPSDAHPVLFFR